MKWLLWLLSHIYAWLNSLNKKLYTRGIFKTVKLSTPVLSVGNLTVGGSGKTPIMIYLVNLFQGHQNKIGVVSRNYKSKVKSIAKIEAAKNGADYYGDEPFLINQKTNAIGYVGPKKSLTAKDLVRNEKVDFIFVDDGFQHHALFKNCNILLIDVTQWESPFKLFPWGRYRDPITEISKANIIFWTKVNFISDEKFSDIKKQIHFKGPQFEFQFLTENYVDFQKQEVKKISELPKRVVLFCGLANPDNLIRTLKELKSDIDIIIKTFPDHHQYKESDLKSIFDKPLNYKYFITTEKDFVKVKTLWPQDQELGIVLLDLKLNTDEKELYEAVSSFLH